MHRFLRLSAAPLLIGATLLAACGSDDASDTTEGAWIAPMLAEIPSSANADPTSVMIVAGDLNRATDAAGLARPDADANTDEFLDWLRPVTGIPLDDAPATVSMLLPEAASPTRLAANDAIRDELGWSLAEVDTFIELNEAPNRFTAIRGDVTAADLDGAIGEADDGIWHLGGDDLSVDVTAISEARPLGESLRMAFEDDVLVVSRTTPDVRGWLDDEPSMADREELAVIAGALDAAEVYSAMMMVHDSSPLAALGVSATPEQLEEFLGDTQLIDPFVAFGAGLSVVDDEPTGTIVYAFATDDAAADAVDTIDDVLTDGASIMSRRPLNEMFEVREVRADGSVVVATIAFRDANPGLLWDMIYGRDLPTISA